MPVKKYISDSLDSVKVLEQEDLIIAQKYLGKFF